MAWTVTTVPRYLKLLTVSSACPLTVMLVVVPFVFLLVMILVFSTLISIP